MAETEKRTVEDFWQEKLRDEIRAAMCKYVSSCNAPAPRKREVLEHELTLAQANLTSTLLSYDKWQRTLWKYGETPQTAKDGFVG
jgi:hypothetical protein